MAFDLRSTGRPRIIAHRGASGSAPENTMSAFRLAVKQHAELLELDVQVTSDGVPVVIHDPTVDRTTSGRGKVGAMSLAQLKTLRIETGGEPEVVPTLDELLAWASGRVPVALELKRDGPLVHPEVVEKVVASVVSHRLEGLCAIISFDHALVRQARELCPRLAGGVLFACAPILPARLAEDASAQAILPHWTSLDARMVREAHEAGLAVCPWVADGEDEMRWVLSLGVDAIATNHPARLAALLG